jgi:hypothetical protein
MYHFNLFTGFFCRFFFLFLIDQVLQSLPDLTYRLQQLRVRLLALLVLLLFPLALDKRIFRVSLSVDVNMYDVCNTEHFTDLGKLYFPMVVWLYKILFDSKVV